MPIKHMYIGKHQNSWLLGTSLFMIFVGAVIASKFDYWYAIVGGAILGVIGCYLSQLSVKWVTETKKEKGNSK